jgi:hypothetical protein
MLWLIWIVLMILVPVAAGMRVWWQLRHEVHEPVPAHVGRDDEA